MKTEECVIRAAKEALQYWVDKSQTMPICVGASLIRYAELLDRGVFSEEIVPGSIPSYIRKFTEVLNSSIKIDNYEVKNVTKNTIDVGCCKGIKRSTIEAILKSMNDHK